MKLRVFKPRLARLPVKAAYGLYLVKLCKAADEQGELEGRFIDITPPTLEEFKEMRKVMDRKAIYRGEI